MMNRKRRIDDLVRETIDFLAWLDRLGALAVDCDVVRQLRWSLERG
jgi:hypothetical protein